MESEPQVVALTERQTRVLWLLSVGRSRADIVKETGDTRGSVDAACYRIFCLLEADSAAQAVRNGLLHGHIGPYDDCGWSVAAYRRHISRDEPICPACKRGNRERMETEAALRSNRIKISEAEVRLLRAFDAGRTRDQIALAWNVNGETIKHLATSAYRSLGVSHLPQSVRREAALREARRRGLLASSPPQQRAPVKNVNLTDTHVKVLLSMESGATLAQTAVRLDLKPGTCSTRLSEAYRRLDVSWMEKGRRLPEAIRRARAMGLLPEPATT
jgi:DNA-binding NarL/FixJ family response regulator